MVFLFVQNNRSLGTYLRLPNQMTMEKSLLILALFIHLASITNSQVCNCNPTTDINRQHRTEAKHVDSFDDFIKKEDTINVAYINKWEKKYKTITNTITRSAHSANSKRQTGSPEDTLYILKGFMWFVKLEKNDCDFHIEIGPRNVQGNRIVVEVAQENSQLQEKIKTHLDQLGEKIMQCGTSSIKTAHFDTPIPVVVIGLGFYDKSHPPNTKHGDDHTKKFSWELHPVRDIIFL